MGSRLTCPQGYFVTENCPSYFIRKSPGDEVGGHNFFEINIEGRGEKKINGASIILTGIEGSLISFPLFPHLLYLVINFRKPSVNLDFF